MATATKKSSAFEGAQVPAAAGPPPTERKAEPALTPEEELEILFPESLEVVVRELKNADAVREVGAEPVRGVRVLKIHAKTMRELVRFAMPIKRIAANVDDTAALADIVLQNHEDFIEVLAIGAGCDHDTIANLLPGDFMKVLVAVLQVNADFFVDALPAMGAKVKRIAAVIFAKLAGAGLIPTSFSLPTEFGILAGSRQEPSSDSSPPPTDASGGNAPTPSAT